MNSLVLKIVHTAQDFIRSANVEQKMKFPVLAHCGFSLLHCSSSPDLIADPFCSLSGISGNIELTLRTLNAVPPCVFLWSKYRNLHTLL